MKRTKKLDTSDKLGNNLGLDRLSKVAAHFGKKEGISIQFLEIDSPRIQENTIFLPNKFKKFANDEKKMETLLGYLDRETWKIRENSLVKSRLKKKEKIRPSEKILDQFFTGEERSNGYIEILDTKIKLFQGKKKPYYFSEVFNSLVSAKSTATTLAVILYQTTEQLRITRKAQGQYLGMKSNINEMYKYENEQKINKLNSYKQENEARDFFIQVSMIPIDAETGFDFESYVNDKAKVWAKKYLSKVMKGLDQVQSTEDAYNLALGMLKTVFDKDFEDEMQESQDQENPDEMQGEPQESEEENSEETEEKKDSGDSDSEGSEEKEDSENKTSSDSGGSESEEKENEDEESEDSQKSDSEDGEEEKSSKSHGDEGEGGDDDEKSEGDGEGDKDDSESDSAEGSEDSDSEDSDEDSSDESGDESGESDDESSESEGGGESSDNSNSDEEGSQKAQNSKKSKSKDGEEESSKSESEGTESGESPEMAKAAEELSKEWAEVQNDLERQIQEKDHGGFDSQVKEIEDFVSNTAQMFDQDFSDEFGKAKNNGTLMGPSPEAAAGDRIIEITPDQRRLKQLESKTNYVAKTLARKLKNVVRVLAQNEVEYDKRNGDLDDDALADIYTGKSNIFMQESPGKNHNNIAWLFLVDLSGSMGGIKNDLAIEALYTCCQAIFDAGNNNFLIAGFDNVWDRGYSGRGSSYGYDRHVAYRREAPMRIHLAKKFTDDWRRVKENVSGMQAGYNNDDGDAVRWAASRLLEVDDVARRELVVFSDGEPSSYGDYRTAQLDLHDAIREVRSAGVGITSVGIMHNTERFYGKEDSMIVNDVEELPSKFVKLIRKKMLGAQGAFVKRKRRKL
jgi:cobalamin biosynthesis protein CobT